MENIQILLSTYNGANFLVAFLKSLNQQTHTNWHILVRDDGSTDDTLTILNQFKESTGKIDIFQGSNIGAKASFAALLELARKQDAPYYAFADQDDQWLPNKLENAMKALTAIEPENSPAMIHTNLTVVDEQLGLISPSFWYYQHLNPERSKKLSYQLVSNTVTGCTMLFNKALLEKIKPLPTGIIMHDWYITLICLCFGKLDYITQPSILYRQHGKNDTGARKWGLKTWFNHLIKPSKIRYSINSTIAQSQLFLSQYQDHLNDHNKNIVSAYAKIRSKNKISRIVTLFKYKLWGNSFLKKIAQILFI